MSAYARETPLFISGNLRKMRCTVLSRWMHSSTTPGAFFFSQAQPTTIRRRGHGTKLWLQMSDSRFAGKSVPWKSLTRLPD